MAPEWPPYVVIFDAKLVNGRLKGAVQYVEPGEQGKTLRVRWNVESQPQDFIPVGEGVAYVHVRRTEADVRSFDRRAAALRPALHDNRETQRGVDRDPGT
jgi:hypothetical protein